MDALDRFWETPPEGKRQECGVAVAVMALVVAGFSPPFVFALVKGCSADSWRMFSMTDLRDFLLSLVFLLTLSPVAIVEKCRIRRAGLAGCVTFLSQLSGWLIVYWLIIWPGFSASPLKRSPLAPFIVLSVMFALFSLFVAAAAVFRARCFFSETSGEWLHSFTVPHGFSFDDAALSFDQLTVDDILDAECVPAERKGKNGSLMLYLDRIPDGGHLLCVRWRSRVRVFPLALPSGSTKKRTYEISRSQVERIAGKFGPVKKTYFLAWSSIHANCPVARS